MPDVLVLVRHAQSVANVANVQAIVSGGATIAVEGPDRDVALSALGKAQAEALGERIAQRPGLPTAFVCSPYRRCLETAEVARAAGDVKSAIVTDDRLHERALGILDKLTPAGVTERFPEEVRKRTAVGKFEYRPPEGESWADVAQRLRPLVADIEAGRIGAARTIVVTHQAVVLCMRLVLEDIPEAELLAIDLAAEVGNCATTTYRRSGDRYVLESYNVPVDVTSDAAGNS